MKKLRYIIDDASDKDGNTYFIYDTKTGQVMYNKSFPTEFEAEVVCDELNGKEKLDNNAIQ